LLKIPCFSVDSVANDLFTRVISLKSAPFNQRSLRSLVYRSGP
jgi:hypothetical protein